MKNYIQSTAENAEGKWTHLKSSKFMNTNKISYMVVLALVPTLNLQAEVKLPSLLSDNMVLQQQSDARFWGWAAPGEKVEVKASWDEAFSEPVTTGDDGKWKTAPLQTL